MARLVFTLCCLMLPIFFASGQQNSHDILYVGTFSESGDKGIYVFAFDRQALTLTEIQSIRGKASPSYMEIHPNKKFLYAVYREGANASDKNGTVTSYRISDSGRLVKMNEQSSEGADPCHVSLDPEGRFLYVSNYGGGNISVYPVADDGSLEKSSDVIFHKGGSVNPSRQKAPHVHSAIPSKDGKFLYVSDLGTDRINIYKVSSSGTLIPAKTPFAKSKPGTGPRHFTLHTSGNYGYSAEELSSTVAGYMVNSKTGALDFIDRVDMLSTDSDFTGNNSAADIHVSPDGRFLYATNRGQDNVVIYAIDEENGKLTLVGHEPSRGGHPRNFCMDQQGEFVFVANRDNDNVVVFRRDRVSGKLSYTGQQATVPRAVCIKQLRGGK